jgi:hypothetical protein
MLAFASWLDNGRGEFKKPAFVAKRQWIIAAGSL